MATALLLLVALATRLALAVSAPAPAPAPPRLVVVQVASPASIAGNREGVLATFSSVPTSGNHLVIASPGDPLGCLPHPAGSNVSGKDTVFVVQRGNCSFEVKAEIAQKAGAKGLIVISDDEKLMTMGGDGDTPTEIFVFSVQKSFGTSLLSQHDPVVVNVNLYTPTLLDFSEVLLVTFATVLVGAGALVSTADLRVGSPLAPQQGDRILEINNKIAVSFCLGGSVMLMVLYFLMDYLIYFVIFGFCLAGIINFMEIGSLSLQHLAPSLRGRNLEVGRCALRMVDVLAFVPSLALGVTWLFCKDASYGWVLQDLMGFGFLCWVQRTVRLPNLKVATLLLCAMFCFDIFWVFLSPFVFGKSVMVKVATGSGGQSVPLLFRIPAFGDPLGRERMLGFGDIAIPGLLVSYVRRHDALSRRRAWQGYFGPILTGYFFGLWATIASLLLMKMAQPALLYLVPGTLGTTLLLATKRKELSYLWHAVPVASEGANNLQAGLTEIAALVNDEGICMRLGTKQGFMDRYYCGRVLGTHAIPGSDGQCGPHDGPQCPSCLRFQETRGPAAAPPPVAP